MAEPAAQAIVAGHICLDLIPSFEPGEISLETLLVPGKLVNVGAATVSTGGAVSNTGMALHRLGTPTALMGKIGADLLGRAVLDVVRGQDVALADGMIVQDDAVSSYTVVINPPGIDRMFLHCPGANDTFGADDVDYGLVAAARLFHFGYPPLMARMFADGGAELTDTFRRAKQAGATCSLDMAWPDPAAPAGQVDWAGVLERTLPHVDLFVPSLDEMLVALDRETFERLAADGDVNAQATPDLLDSLAERLLAMGASIVLLKLGEQGLYLRTCDDAGRIAAIGPAAPSDPAAWAGRQLAAPAFQVEVAGTTGAGDCAVAGFLAALLRDSSPTDALTAAAAVGACNVERPDATSGVPHWDTVRDRIAAAWPRRAMQMPLRDWREDGATGIWHGPRDHA